MKSETPPRHKALIIHSPRSGRSEQLSQALDLLHANGIEITASRSITDLDGLPAQGKDWSEQDIDLVVAAGGDGLVGGVIAHTAGYDLPVGILPLGTANDVARTVQIPQDVPQAVETIVKGKQINIDLGQAHPAEQAPHQAQPDGESLVHIPASKAMYFAHALTVGLNVQFARLATDRSRREQFGPLTYPVAVIESLRTYKPIEVEISFDGLLARTGPGSQTTVLEQPVTYRGKCAQVTAVNSSIFWGPLQATVPGVSLNDKLLDIVVVEDAGIDQLLFRITRFFGHLAQQEAQKDGWHAQYPHLLNAELTDIPGIHHFKTHALTITTPESSQDATLDGEVRGQTPIQAQAAHERACLIVPQTYESR